MPFHDQNSVTSKSSTTAEDWFHSGSRVWYDPSRRLMSPRKTETSIGVFERVVNTTSGSTGARWITFLPGYPDGSFGYARIEDELAGSRYTAAPRLYIEYFGQGDSDRPVEKGYQYTTMERADLVQAQWHEHGVKRTVVVTFDFSSLVLLELLRRCQEGRSPAVIEHVLCINGKLYPGNPRTNPGREMFRSIALSVAPRSNIVLDSVVLKPMYSKEYQARQGKAQIRQELKEKRTALRRHDNSTFILSKGFVSEDVKPKPGPSTTNPPNQKSKESGGVSSKELWSKRWDLSSIYTEYCLNRGITIELVCSKDDRYEYQYQVAKRTLGQYYYPSVRIDFVPGGHMALTEQAELLSGKIQALATKGYTADTATQRTWVTLDVPSSLPTSNNNSSSAAASPDTTTPNKKKPFRPWVTLSAR